jgi:hypothetical protein
MGTFKYKNKEYNIYKYSAKDLEFIFVKGEEKKFWQLLKTYKTVENIPDKVLLTGIFFNKGTRNLGNEYRNRHIIANHITK